MHSSSKFGLLNVQNHPKKQILLTFTLIMLLTIIMLNINFNFITKPITTNTTIKTPINLVFTYGVSLIKEQNINQSQLTSNGNSFTLIEARVIFNSTNIITNHNINNTIQVLFDNVMKKQINLILSNKETSPITMGVIVVTSSEIEKWDASQNKTHIIVFRIPEKNATANNEDNKYKWQLAEKSIIIKVSKKNTSNFTIFYSGSQYVTENTFGNQIYTGSSASNAIQVAFNSVNLGQTILIKSGLYNLTNALTLTQEHVTIIGENNTILQATKEMGSIFYFTGKQNQHSSGLILENIVFDCNLKAAGPSVKWIENSTFYKIEIKNTKKAKLVNGLEIQGSTTSIIKGITVTQCYIHNIYGSGIAIEFITDSKISNNTMVDCAQYYPSGGAILANDGCKKITVQNNNISGRSDNDGIYLGTSRSFASECTISGNTINLKLYGTGGGSKFAGSGIKIYALNSELSGNTINWNGTPFVYGIENWGKGNSIYNNTISNAHVGYGSQRGYYNAGSTVTGNKISECDEGMEILQRGSIITGNTITHCTTPIQAISGNTINGNIIN